MSILNEIAICYSNQLVLLLIASYATDISMDHTEPVCFCMCLYVPPTQILPPTQIFPVPIFNPLVYSMTFIVDI